ncbi:hypothetical protein BD410DRAFT_802152 [Rickenella mellea]|uniref:Uncharacterized protein n=1 Tax=Rickenella mellea TaxID=50990 RepID=A0A4Y7QB78_9AGAM|nr:hypothetical protein BD410DRAFT_802152 [Rickenella mellea]
MEGIVTGGVDILGAGAGGISSIGDGAFGIGIGGATVWMAKLIKFPEGHTGTLRQDDKLFVDHWGKGIGNIPTLLPPGERTHHWDALKNYGCLVNRGDDISPLPDFGALQISINNKSFVDNNNPSYSYTPPPPPAHLHSTTTASSSPIIHIEMKGLDMDAPGNKAKPKGLHSHAANDGRAKSMEWTAKQRVLAAQAKVPADLEELKGMVCEGFNEDGVRISEDYVRVPASLVTENMKFTDKNGKEILFIMSPNAVPKSVRDEISSLWGILDAFVPSVTAQGNHVAAQEGFHAFHFCQYNKYAEKGDGAPEDIPHYELKGNKYQRQTYLSQDVHKYPELFNGLVNNLEETMCYVNDRMKEFIPETHERHMEYLRALPLGGLPLHPPFTGLVVNIAVATEAHRDEGDD